MSGVVGDGNQTRDVLELGRLGKVPVLKVSKRAAVRENNCWFLTAQLWIHVDARLQLYGHDHMGSGTFVSKLDASIVQNLGEADRHSVCLWSVLWTEDWLGRSTDSFSHGLEPCQCLRLWVNWLLCKRNYYNVWYISYTYADMY